MSKVIENIQAGIVEFLGTFILCFMGGFAVLNSETNKTAEDITISGVALAHGLTLAFIVWAGGPISGGH